MPRHKQQSIVAVTTVPPLERAVAYVRVSTEHQQYSIYNQMTAIEAYASAHQLNIVQTYSDEGISGLTIRERPALRQLVTDIVGRKVSFSRVLVYDISRWGRFQDTDESAFYEYVCRMHGIQITYCAEPFENDHTPLSAVVKAVKRAMAAEYSRELSAKCSRGHFNLARRGYVQGGPAKYGLRHIVVDGNGRRIRGQLTDERKLRRDCRVRLAQGPKKEVETVREIFRRYVELGETTSQLAHYLNEHGHKTRSGRYWNVGDIGGIIGDEQYAGSVVYNRTTTKLKTRRKHNDRSEWIVTPNVFEPIVDLATVRRAQERRSKELQELQPPSNEELLDRLRSLLKKRGVISEKVISRSRDVPSSCLYISRFGSIFNAYRLIGYPGGSRNVRWNVRFRLREVRSHLIDEMRVLLREMGLEIESNPTVTHFMVSNGIGCTFGISKSYELASGRRWLFRCETKFKLPFHLFGRLDADGRTVLDYYLVPRAALKLMPYRMKARSTPEIEEYHAASLNIAVKRLVHSV
jgi:DNA invertase Pin-like site-specific DNA recombinase